MFEDKVLQCRDCGKDFVFTAGEQEFYAKKGFSDPARCRDCRIARKKARGDYDRPRQMYEVICDDCGKKTMVPFKPRGDRPVYCKECFEARRNRDSRRSDF